uniref:Uncharacterized protein n=1 Tax=Rhizophora mucronata TaxID=61149 RepID=A0A2P2JXR3_RHIMU
MCLLNFFTEKNYCTKDTNTKTTKSLNFITIITHNHKPYN